MKYLKLFDTESDYKAYRDGVVGGGYIKPNVSLSVDTNKIHYNLDVNGHEYVDLELPSGTLWATQNVGASKASEAGLYFQWGDTQGYTADQVGEGEGQKAFKWNDYKWSIEGSETNFSKYTIHSATLDLEDDAANFHMGGNWHMPTHKQCQELIDNTTSAWTTQDGVNGRLFTSKKDSSKYIFIPAAGFATDGLVDEIGYSGNIWSSSASDHGIGGSLSLGCFSDNALVFNDSRSEGFPVRGVVG